MAEINQLLQDLKSQNFRKRTVAARKLATMQDEHIVPALSKALTQIPFWHTLRAVRKTIRIWITLFRTKGAIPEKYSYPFHYPFFTVLGIYQHTIIKALVIHRDARAVKALGRLLNKSLCFIKPETVLEAIAIFDSEEVWLILCNALKQKYIVEDTAQELHRRDKIRAIEPLIEAFAMRQYQNPKQGDFFSTQRLIYYTQQKLIELLVDIGEPAVPNLIKALQAKNDLIRDGAAKTLERIGDKRAVEPLWEARHNTDYAVLALAQLDYEKAVGELIKIVENVAFYVEEAAQILGEHKEERAVSALSTQVTDYIAKWYHPEETGLGYFAYMNAIVDALEKIGTPEALAVATDWQEKYGKRRQ